MSLYRIAPVLVYSLLLASACKDPNYCAGHPDNDCRFASDGAIITQCSRDQDCRTPDAICDVAGTHTCVQCTPAEPAECTGTSPVCLVTQCQPCTSHSQCTAPNTTASDVCLADGSCAAVDQVAYVDPAGTDNPQCTKATPCTKVMSALATNRPYVKFAAGTTDEVVQLTGGRVVTFLADPNAVLTRSMGGGAIITLQGDGTSLTIYDLTISNAPNNPSGIGLVIPAGNGAPSLSLVRAHVTNNPGGGISSSAGTVTVSQSALSNNAGGGISSSGGSLTVSQSTLSNNAGGGISSSGGGTLTVSRSTVIGNTNGGIVVTGNAGFDIENNFIVYNGVATGVSASQTGGASILANTNGSKFEFNTIAFNQSNGLTFRGGASCNAPLVSASFNLVYHNTESDGSGGTKTDTTTQINTTGGCLFGNTLAVPTDPGNLGFKSPLVMPYDFHLTAASPPSIVDAGGACTGVDFDGDTRPIGKACDLGADEYHP